MAGVSEQVLTLPASGFTRAGWTFTGWNTAADGTGTSYAVGAGFTLAPSTNILFAQWSADPATLAYDANTGTGTTASTTGVTDQVVTVAANAFTKLGYTFAGWNTVADGSGTSIAPGDQFQLPVGTTTVYALWLANPATLVYGANQGTGTMDPTGGVTDEVVIVAVDVFTRAGYTFTGWNTAADGTGTPYAEGAAFTLAAGTNVLFAQWAADVATLSFDANGGVGTGTDITGVTDEVVTLPVSPFTKDGYTFAGWNTSADGSGTSLAPGGQFSLPAGATTLFAQWVANAAAIRYDANGGTGTTESTIGVTDEVVKVAANAFTRDGFTFTGWNTAADGTGTAYTPGASFTFMQTVNVLYAQWSQDPTPTTPPTDNPTNNGGGLAITGAGYIGLSVGGALVMVAAGAWLMIARRNRREQTH